MVHCSECHGLSHPGVPATLSKFAVFSQNQRMSDRHPVLPLQDGYMAADEFFIYKFSREQAGLSGLAFDEGQFGVFGYVTGVRAANCTAMMWPLACLLSDAQVP